MSEGSAEKEVKFSEMMKKMDEKKVSDFIDAKDYMKDLSAIEKAAATVLLGQIIDLGRVQIITPEGSIKITKALLCIFEDALDWASKKVKEGG